MTVINQKLPIPHWLIFDEIYKKTRYWTFCLIFFGTQLVLLPLVFVFIIK